MKPCTQILVGVLRPLNFSMAGQNRVWKVMMSLPMKWYCSRRVGHVGVVSSRAWFQQVFSDAR